MTLPSERRSGFNPFLVGTARGRWREGRC